MFLVQINPGNRWRPADKKFYWGDAVDCAARYVRDKIPARVREYDPNKGRYVTRWEHDPFDSAHPTDKGPL